jgi:hypothetical protein
MINRRLTHLSGPPPNAALTFIALQKQETYSQQMKEAEK